jgi:transcriptional regulator with XRE-family HTH domain
MVTMTERETMGQRLRRLREQRVYTQKGLAEVAGVHYVSLAKIEADKSDPHASTIRKLAAALDVSPEYLKFGD